MRQKRIGVVIGKFQVPELHEQHIALIQHVMNVSDDTCVLVGTDPNNPEYLLPFECVEQSIRTDFVELFHVHPLVDVPNNDLNWSMQLDRFLQLLFPFAEITLYCGRDGFRTRYHGKHRPVTVWSGNDPKVSATRIRESIISSAPVDSPIFRAGIIYGKGNYVQSQLSATDRFLQSKSLEATAPQNDLHL